MRMLIIQCILGLLVTIVSLSAKSINKKFNINKNERSCYHTAIIPKSRCFYKLDCDPLRYYMIKEHEDGKMYYIPIIHSNICNRFKSRFQHYPFLISSQKYGVRLIHTYHDILKRYCIDQNSNGKFYYIPNDNEGSVNLNKMNVENKILSDYCKEHYRHIDYDDINNKEDLNVALHLPDINNRIMKPYKFKIIKLLSQRNVENEPWPQSEFESEPQSELINRNNGNDKESKRYINFYPHYHNAMPFEAQCDKCTKENRDFLDEFDHCDICESEKVPNICNHRTGYIDETSTYQCDDK